MRTKLLALAIGGAAMFGTLGAAAPSQALEPQRTIAQANSESKVNPDEIQALLTKFLVPEGQQKDLIKKAKQGLKWDVYDLAAAPVSVEHDRIIDGMNYTIKRYPDGSIAAQGIEVPQIVDPNTPSPMAIHNCNITTGSGYAAYRNCQIDGIWGTVLLGAYGVNFTLVNGAFDSIGSVGAGFQKCIAPTSCSTPSQVLFSPQEGVGPAYSRWQSDVNAPWASWNVWVQLNVGGNTYWQTNS